MCSKVLLDFVSFPYVNPPETGFESPLFKFDRTSGPCGRWRPGDADLHSFDLIREFSLDKAQSRYHSISEIEGSNVLQKAYRLERESNLTMRTIDAFPRGFPQQFSFECTYRSRQPTPNSWHLFDVTNSYEESQLAITMNPGEETLELTVPNVNGDLQTVAFQHSSVIIESIKFFKNRRKMNALSFIPDVIDSSSIPDGIKLCWV